MIDKPKAPAYVLMTRRITTQREWRRIKRAELKELEASFRKYQIGCAFCPPADAAVGRIEQAIEDLKRELSPQNWGD